MTSTAGPGRPRRWTAGLAWALWLASLLLCLAVVPWLDELLRQAGRADLVQFTPGRRHSRPGPGELGHGRGGRGRPPPGPPGGLAAAGHRPVAHRHRRDRPVLRVRAAGPPGRAARRPLRRAVPAGDRVHGPDPDRLRPAADAHRVAALAPLALAGQGDGGHAGRPGAGGDPGRRAGGPALPGPRRPLRPPRPRRGPAGRQPDGPGGHRPGPGGRGRVPGGAVPPRPRGRAAAAALGGAGRGAGGAGRRRRPVQPGGRGVGRRNPVRPGRQLLPGGPAGGHRGGGAALPPL